MSPGAATVGAENVMVGILDALGLVNVPGARAMNEAHAEIAAMLPPLPDIDGMSAYEWACGEASKAWLDAERAAMATITADELADWRDGNEARQKAFAQFSPRRAAHVERMVRATMDRLLLD